MQGHSVTVECDKSMIGRVIGKNGDTVKALQSYTGAFIHIDQTVQPTKVTISGSAQSLQLAVSMVTDIVKGTFKGFALLRQSTAPLSSRSNYVPTNFDQPRPVYVPGYGLIPSSQSYDQAGQDLPDGMQGIPGQMPNDITGQAPGWMPGQPVLMPVQQISMRPQGTMMVSSNVPQFAVQPPGQMVLVPGEYSTPVPGVITPHEWMYYDPSMVRPSMMRMASSSGSPLPSGSKDRQFLGGSVGQQPGANDFMNTSINLVGGSSLTGSNLSGKVSPVKDLTATSAPASNWVVKEQGGQAFFVNQTG